MAIIKIEMGGVFVQTPADLKSIEFCIEALEFFIELFGGKKK